MPARARVTRLKYRRGAGEIIIVNHDGRGWWDATSSAKGDVFNLVQHLDPSLNFGQVRLVLRSFVGAVPNYPGRPPTNGSRAKADRTPAERWADIAPRLAPRRLLHGPILAGPRAHPGRRVAGRGGSSRTAFVLAPTTAPGSRIAGRSEISQVEIRGPTFKGSLQGRAQDAISVRRARFRLSAV